MRRLKLYVEPPRAAIELAEPIRIDHDCARCKWSAGPRRACLSPDGEAGGLLVVGDFPIKGANRPFMSVAGQLIRDVVRKHWDGPVVYDYAVKCPPADVKTQLRNAASFIKECRPYLSQVMDDAKPRRIIAVGLWAVHALLGRTVDLESVRRGYSFTSDGTPVFIIGNPLMQNRFYVKRFKEELRSILEAQTPTPTHWDGIVSVVETEADALVAERALSIHDELAFDVEAAGVMHDDDYTVLCAGLSPVDSTEGDAWVWSATALSDTKAKAVLARILLGSKIVGSNVKYDADAAEHDIGPIPNMSFDTQYVRKLLEPTCMGRLEYAAELVGMGGHKEEAHLALKKAIASARLKVWKPGSASHDHWCVKGIRDSGHEAMRYAFGLLPEDLLWRYNGRDVVTSAAATILIRERAEVEQPRELKVWEKVYQPSMASFVRIERAGMQADRQAFEMFSQYLKVQVDVLRDGFKAWGSDFNPSSSAQVANVLFKKLGLPIDDRKRSKKTGAPSTDADVLAGLKGQHPFVDQLLEYRRLEHMDSTYGRGMLKYITSRGRIHPSYRFDGTETGRISSENPNGQNIPRPDTTEGKMARDGFTASPGRVLVSLDYSQLELRVAAAMSGDPQMIAVFNSGVDYHLRTAQLIAPLLWPRIPASEVAAWTMVTGKFYRSYAKTVNFGLLYGKTDNGLAEQLGCTPAEAAAVRKAILGTFGKLKEMIERLLYFARRNASIEVPWDDEAVHVRPLYDIGSPDRWKVQNAENSSINTPIQGKSAWYALCAIPRIHQWIDDSGIADQCDIVSTVHDSIMLDCAPALVDDAIANVRRLMVAFDCGEVPLVVDADAGSRWGSIRGIKDGELYDDAQVRWVAEALKKEAA